MQNYIKPGMTMIQICQELETRSRMLIGENGLKAGKLVCWMLWWLLIQKLILLNFRVGISYWM